MIGKRTFYFLVLGVVFLLGCQGKKSGDQEVESAEEPVEAAPSDEPNELLSVEAAPSDEPNELLSVEDYIARHYPEYAILKVIPSNLLPDIEEESLVFLEDPIRNARMRARNQPHVEEPWPPSIDKILCVYVADGRTQEHVLAQGLLGHSESVLRVILSYESLYGPWLDYCYLSDVDGDGIQEVIIFVVSGIGFHKITWKFQDGEFQLIDDEDLSNSPLG